MAPHTKSNAYHSNTVAHALFLFFIGLLAESHVRESKRLIYILTPSNKIYTTRNRSTFIIISISLKLAICIFKFVLFCSQSLQCPKQKGFCVTVSAIFAPLERFLTVTAGRTQSRSRPRSRFSQTVITLVDHTRAQFTNVEEQAVIYLTKKKKRNADTIERKLQCGCTVGLSVTAH